MKRGTYLFLIFLLGFSVMVWAQSAMKGLHGDFQYLKKGLHAGNQLRITFFNDGTYGCNASNPKGQGGIGGEWPINSGHPYILDGNVFVASEVIDANGEVKHISSTVTSAGTPGRAPSETNWSCGDNDLKTGEWWTFLPLPGFANPDTTAIAMTKWPWSWPPTWPDKSDDPVDPGWPGAWNGYFGKDQFNADEEAYFVSDDYNKKEFNFFPDSTDPNRRGLGMRMYVRSFQWSNALVEDCLYCLFDIENIGTYHHDKMAFGYKIGNNVGETDAVYGGEGDDDCGEYDLTEDIAYLYDYDNVGAGGWSPVGWVGGAFLESPGNPNDGIDNDGDGINGPGPVITEALFAPKVLKAGDPIILIDYKTFERTKSTMPADTLVVHYMDQVFKFWPGKTVEEIQNNLVDDNLNGLIDENNGTVAGTPPNEIRKYLYIGLKYINYFTGEGLDNPLIDERRDDGIDNDGDWNAYLDDLGQDGKENTQDPGEKDGKPTYGEPHFDKTDISETDMIGLTSFNLYEWTTFAHSDDEAVWVKLRPGKLDNAMYRANIELFWGSGYFPMKPGDIQRFSMGLVLGLNRDELFTNKKYMERAYTENYNFARAPLIPTLTAVPGDGRVTLYWDDIAEHSYDPISGYDFEGYRIYRSTDPGWNDMTPITDGQGSVTYRKPIAQFDLKNGITGFSPVPLRGVHFYLGDDTGIRHSWVDTTVVNGFTYYYAITSYDRGEGLEIAPSECSKFISVGPEGKIEEKGRNVVVVRPEAPSAGYVSPYLKGGVRLLPGGTTSGKVKVDIIDPKKLLDGHIYHVTFEETLKVVANRADTLYTKNVSVVDVTDGRVVIDRYEMRGLDDRLPFKDGFELILQNESTLAVDEAKTGWNNTGLYDFDVAPYYYRDEEEAPLSRDFDIVIGENVGVDTSKEFVRRGKTVPGKPVNFTVIDPYTGERLPFGFYEQDGTDGVFSAFTPPKKVSDEVVVLNRGKSGNYVGAWVVKMLVTTDLADRRGPAPGDTFRVRLTKPFLAHDIFEFEIKGEGIDKALAKKELDKIKVVPNPYIVTNSWEPLNPYSTGRGPRELHFIHLPSRCTIRIFNVRGQLVAELKHDTPDIADGTEIWNMQSKDNLDISYGVYIYHVDAGELGEKVGKFAVIK